MSNPFVRITTTWHRYLVLGLLTLAVALPGLASLPVIDRDEARYVQASVQMAESGDYVNIRFQDQARNKKPAGIYWMQAAMIKAFTQDGERKIWAHRLPSVLGALLAVLATYWGGARLIGRDGAFTAAMLLAISGLFVFEAHIAKTDAVLCGLSALALGCLAHLRSGGGKKIALVFWLALGLAVMIKGPIVPGIAGLTLGALFLWERQTQWAKPLLFWPGPLLFLLIILPWSVLIWQATDGQFFAESLGQDFGGKIVGVQEKHPGPPGYYLGAIWATFWPSALFLLPGFIFAVKAVRGARNSDTETVRAARLLLAWTVPFWLAIEIMPTKLPHYPLPVFPALALMSAGAITRLLSRDDFQKTRRVSAIIFALVALVFCGVIIWAAESYGGHVGLAIIVGVFTAILAIIAAFSLWHRKMNTSFAAVLLIGLMFNGSLYASILPGLTDFRLADRVSQAFADNNMRKPLEAGPQVYSPHFREPSLVYRLGTDIELSENGLLRAETWEEDFIVIADVETEEGQDLQGRIKDMAAGRSACIRDLSPIDGFNYSKGDRVSLQIIAVTPCPR